MLQEYQIDRTVVDPPEESRLKKRRRKLLCARGDPMEFDEKDYDEALYTSVVSSSNNLDQPLPTHEWNRLILNGARYYLDSGMIIWKKLFDVQASKNKVDPVEIVEYFLGEDVEAEFTYRSLRDASMCGFFDTVRVLCGAGGLKPEPLLGCNPAHHFLGPFKLEMMKLAVELGADVHARQYGGNRADTSPLELMLEPKYYEIARLLISFGIVPTRPDSLTELQESIFMTCQLDEREYAKNIMRRVPKSKYKEIIKTIYIQSN